LPVALTKTIGSMVVSILAYMWAFGWDWRLAVGFVLLILVHEMGHVIALRHYGYSASPPIFIPFMGALINLRQPPRNAWEEAMIGIGGPVLGTIGSLACFAVWWFFPESTVALKVAIFGFMLNFFNMLPIPPLDGGRVTAAISPWVWIVGLAAMAYWLYLDYTRTGHINFIIVLIIFFAFPRIRQTLENKSIRSHPYYQIGRGKNWAMGIAYLSLSALLAFFYFGYRGQLWI
jgi:Zn-dependent protease